MRQLHLKDLRLSKIEFSFYIICDCALILFGCVASHIVSVIFKMRCLRTSLNMALLLNFCKAAMFSFSVKHLLHESLYSMEDASFHFEVLHQCKAMTGRQLKKLSTKVAQILVETKISAATISAV